MDSEPLSCELDENSHPRSHLLKFFMIMGYNFDQARERLAMMINGYVDYFPWVLDRPAEQCWMFYLDGFSERYHAGIPLQQHAWVHEYLKKELVAAPGYLGENNPWRDAARNCLEALRACVPGVPLEIQQVGGTVVPTSISLEGGKVECSVCHRSYKDKAIAERHFLEHSVGYIVCPFRHACKSNVKFYRWDRFNNHCKKLHKDIPEHDATKMSREDTPATPIRMTPRLEEIPEDEDEDMMEQVQEQLRQEQEQQMQDEQTEEDEEPKKPLKKIPRKNASKVTKRRSKKSKAQTKSKGRSKKGKEKATVSRSVTPLSVTPDAPTSGSSVVDPPAPEYPTQFHNNSLPRYSGVVDQEPVPEYIGTASEHSDFDGAGNIDPGLLARDDQNQHMNAQPNPNYPAYTFQQVGGNFYYTPTQYSPAQYTRAPQYVQPQQLNAQVAPYMHSAPMASMHNGYVQNAPIAPLNAGFVQSATITPMNSGYIQQAYPQHGQMEQAPPNQAYVGNGYAPTSYGYIDNGYLNNSAYNDEFDAVVNRFDGLTDAQIDELLAQAGQAQHYYDNNVQLEGNGNDNVQDNAQWDPNMQFMNRVD